VYGIKVFYEIKNHGELHFNEWNLKQNVNGTKMTLQLPINATNDMNVNGSEQIHLCFKL
jgi:hypothetical protein